MNAAPSWICSFSAALCAPLPLTCPFACTLLAFSAASSDALARIVRRSSSSSAPAPPPSSAVGAVSPLGRADDPDGSWSCSTSSLCSTTVVERDDDSARAEAPDRVLAVDGWRPRKNPDRSRKPRGFLIVLVGVGVGVDTGVSAIVFVGVVEPLGGGEPSLSSGCSRIVCVSTVSDILILLSGRSLGVSRGDWSAEIVLDEMLKGRCGLRQIERRFKSDRYM